MRVEDLPDIEILLPIMDEVKTMIELGNKRTNVVWKHVFEAQGISHTSIDINGKDGALPLDLCSEIDLPPADVVTNFGTSEHVANQDVCFHNIDKLSKKWMVHVVPYVGNWIGHGLNLGMECYKYTERHFESLAAKYNYQIEDIYVAGKPKRKLVYCRMRK